MLITRAERGFDLHQFNLSRMIDLPQGARLPMPFRCHGDRIAAARPRSMTSDEILRELGHIDWLIAALNASQAAEDIERDDLRWLAGRRRFLGSLIEIRRAQMGKKVVSLDLWRDGRAVTARNAAQVA
jgi:hypothetical protein